MQLKIIRGISGSGKSTYAKTHFPDFIICSADDFFMVKNKYKFDPKKLPNAHACCLLKCIDNILQGNKVVVDNTNTRLIELAPYVAIGNAYKYKVEIIRIECDWEVAAKRGIHKVPKETVLRMYNSMETSLPPYWPKETVVRI